MGEAAKKTRTKDPETPTTDRTAYNKDYYRDHAADIAERRRQRYHEDKEYKEKRLAAAREYRERLQKEREKKAARKGQEYVRRRGGPRKPVEVTVAGEVEQAFTIRTLAKATKKSLATIRAWRTKGLFPVTPYQTLRGDALYTQRMIKALASVLRQYARMTFDSEFREAVEKRWIEQGVPVGKRVVVSR